MNWTARDLAEKAGVHRNTVSNAEVQRYAGASGTLNPIQHAIEKAGVDSTKIGKSGVKLR